MKPLAPPTLVLGPVPMRVLGTAAAFPEHEVTTSALLETLAHDIPAARRAALAEHFDEDVGVRTRAHLKEGTARDLAVRAARAALDAAGVTAPRAVVYATSTPSRWTSAESAWLARDLGLEGAFFDVRSGCTGGLYGLVEGARLARDTSGPVLVVAADAFSKTFGAERLLPVSMGDGAGALVLGPSEDASCGIVRAVFGGAPDRVELATVPGALPPQTLDAAVWALSGDPEAFSAATTEALGLALDTLAPADDAVIVVQTGRASIARQVASRRSRAPYLVTLARHGNIGAGSLLVALDAIVREGSASRVALVSAGGGLSFGAAEVVVS